MLAMWPSSQTDAKDHTEHRDSNTPTELKHLKVMVLGQSHPRPSDPQNRGQKRLTGPPANQPPDTIPTQPRRIEHEQTTRIAYRGKTVVPFAPSCTVPLHHSISDQCRILYSSITSDRNCRAELKPRRVA